MIMSNVCWCVNYQAELLLNFSTRLMESIKNKALTCLMESIQIKH